MNQVTATSSTTTTHAHTGVALAINDNCVIEIFQISTQAFYDRTCSNDVNDFFHFLTGLYFPLLADRDLAPFSKRHRIRLLAFLRARLSTLLYKSIKRTCLFDFDNTNVWPERLVSKLRQKFF
jgi:hypothetical protein